MSESLTPARVIEWEVDDAVYLASVPRGPIVVVAGTALIIWRALCEGELSGTATRVADSIGVDVELVRPDVERFIARLRAEGLIVNG